MRPWSPDPRSSPQTLRTSHGAAASPRVVQTHGTITLACVRYHVGRWLSGETVDVLLTDDGLLQISHRGVLVATHARRHSEEREGVIPKNATKSRRPKPQTAGIPVIRKVDMRGSISFAGAGYRVGNGYRLRQVEVRVVGDTVQISYEGRLLRTHKAKHDPVKEHGAFANPTGRPRRINAAS